MSNGAQPLTHAKMASAKRESELIHLQNAHDAAKDAHQQALWTLRRIPRSKAYNAAYWQQLKTVSAAYGAYLSALDKLNKARGL
jgi:hypothetical protein